MQLPPLTAEEILDSALDPEQALIAKEERARTAGILPPILMGAPSRIDTSVILRNRHDVALTLLVPHREEGRVMLPKDADLDAEIAKGFTVTRERMREIERKALQKLRAPSRSRKLRAFLDGSAN